MIDYKIRPGTTADLPFLEEMLYEAVFWHPDAERTPRKEIFAVPEIADILADWGKRDGDFSLIAVDAEEKKLGAVWYRFWTKENASFGFVDEETPEIGLAIIKEARGRGIGTDLIKQTIEHANLMEIKKLSLSVEAKNPALNLYKRFGFEKVTIVENSWTMVLNL